MPTVYAYNVFTNRLDIADIDILPPGDVEFLEGDAGGSVGPDAGHVVYVKGGIGTTITGNPGTNTLLVNVTGGGLAWTRVAGAAQALAASNGYIPTNAGLTTFTLPAAAALGEVYEIIGEGAGGWTIAQNAAQSIRFGNVVSTVGIGGSVASTNQYDTIQLTCTVVNTTWSVTKSVGVLNIT